MIEPAAGATRTMMAFLLAAYDEDEVGGESRTVLRLHWRLAPYQVAVLPLSKKDTLEPLARQVLKTLQPHFMCDYDVTQGIGKRYRRQDEVGTPWCVTVDFDSLEDNAVTVRDRDTTDQVRVPITELLGRAAPAHRRGVSGLRRPCGTCAPRPGPGPPAGRRTTAGRPRRRPSRAGRRPP